MPSSDARPTAFAFRRQRLDGAAPDALAAVTAAIGVYAVNPSGPLSILARAPRTTGADVLALDVERRVVRARAMRTSAFVVPAGTAPVVVAATSRPAERSAWMLRSAGVAPEDLDPIARAVSAAAVQPRTARELRTATGFIGVGLGQLLSYLVTRGDLVVIGAAAVTSNTNRYQAREAWLALAGDAATSPAAAPPPDEARAWLAGAYLRSFGPARIEDLAWWAGFPRPVAEEAVGAHVTADVEDGLLLHADDLPAYEACKPLADVPVLVPKWDAWTMGYPIDGRARFVDRDVHDRLFDGDGNGFGAVLVRGRAVGAWSHRGTRGRMEVSLDLFERPSGRFREAVSVRLGEAAAFLGYRDLHVRDVATVMPDRPRVRRPLA